MRYGLRRHPNKGKTWVVENYFKTVKHPHHPNDKWIFGDKETNVPLLQLRHIPIRRHIMVPNGYSPFDPTLENFWFQRKFEGIESNLVLTGDIKIARNQRHICPLCFHSLYNQERIEKHHIIPRVKGGTNKYSNLVWLHKVCHQSITAKEEEFVKIIQGKMDEIKKFRKPGVKDKVQEK